MYVAKPGEVFQQLGGNFQGVDINCPKYKISNLGNIVDIETGFPKSITNNEDEYPTTNINSKQTSIHIMVALIFVPGRTEENCFVNHKDENKNNFVATNLEWGSVSYNNKYSAYKTSIPVKKISMETGEVLGVFDSRVDAAKSLGKNSSAGSDIGKACSGEATHAFGFYWRDIPFEEIENYPELTINQRKAMYPPKMSSTTSTT